MNWTRPHLIIFFLIYVIHLELGLCLNYFKFTKVGAGVTLIIFCMKID